MGERAQRTKPPRAVLLKKERWLKKRRSETRALVFCSRERFVSCTQSHAITALIMLAAWLTFELNTKSSINNKLNNKLSRFSARNLGLTLIVINSNSSVNQPV